jgi:hypothetical protein
VSDGVSKPVKVSRKRDTGVFEPFDDKEDVGKCNQGDNATTAAVPDSTDLPPTCPSSYCRDNVPLLPSHVLITLFKELRILEADRAIKVDEVGSENLVPLLPIEKKHISICNQIKRERLKDLAINRASRNGWPTVFDFRRLPDRIVAMDELLSQLIFDRTQMEICFVWEQFADELGISAVHSDDKESVKILKKFVKNTGQQQKLSDQARPG